MTGRRQLPPVDELVHMREVQGLTLTQMVDTIEREHGETVTTSAVSQALARAGKAQPAPRYNDVIPWRVMMIHQKHQHLRMLRLYGREQAGLPLDEQQKRRLENWKKKLDEKNAVVHYRPHEEPGFVLVPRREGIDKGYTRTPAAQLQSA